MSKGFLRNLSIGFGLSLLVVISCSIASYLSVQKQRESKRLVDRTKAAILLANQVLSELQSAETGQRGYLLTDEAEYLQHYHESKQKLPESIRQLRRLLSPNRDQASRADTLEIAVTRRLDLLEGLLQNRNHGQPLQTEYLALGKSYMDSARHVIERMVSWEEETLTARTTELDRSTRLTTVFIMLATLASLIIAVVSYLRLRADFNSREELRRRLSENEQSFRNRIQIIKDIANKIAAGDYSASIEDSNEDDLGNVALSLKKMTTALKSSFDKLTDSEWRKAGTGVLQKKLMGNKTEKDVMGLSLTFLTEYLECISGALYVQEEEGLVLKHALGLEDRMQHVFQPTEGMIGRAFTSGTMRELENIDPTEFVVSFSAGKIMIKNILFIPVTYEQEPIGVIELARVEPFGENDKDLLNELGSIIGLSLASAKSRKRLQSLLEETQAQTEELQVQHTELENLNAELETQASKLRISEEELRVQQEELVKSNQQLEERAVLLEEKNQLIAVRNLEINERAEALALSTRYKSEFLANMSHELRTPLNSILLLARVLSENNDNNLSAEQIESAQVIWSSGTSLLNLIDEILDLSKIEAGKMQLEAENISIAEIARNVEQLFRPLVREKGLTLIIQSDATKHRRITTDKLRLEQVLRNFLSNAIKFTEKGTVTLSIEENPHNDDSILFIVADSGIGIAPERQSVIFEAFQQADGSTKRKYGGTGLGLSISREIAKLLDGEIRVESELGIGSTFTLVIPATLNSNDKTETQVLLDAISEDSAQSRVLGELPPSYVPQLNIPDVPEDDSQSIVEGDKVILIVEDDVTFAKELLKYTRSQGFKGVVVVQGDKALPAANTYLPLAILLDIQLPIMDGWEVMEKLKGDPKTKHIPVHIMSSFQVRKESLRQGAIDFIDKPIAIEKMRQMFQKIEEALSKGPKKVLIIEENPKHATALSYFLSSYEIVSEIRENVDDSIKALISGNVECVILDMGVPDTLGYRALETIKSNPGLEELPIIVFTGRNLSNKDEMHIKQYADSIVVKTAQSYQRLLDEVSLFLHLVGSHSPSVDTKLAGKPGSLSNVLSGKKILIADDDIRNIYSLSKVLEKFNVNVVSAVDGSEALSQLKDNPDTDIVLMDMMMPNVDGYETIKQIRSDDQYSYLPIIAVTAKAMTGDRERCIEAGASDYISKPVDVDQLLSLLRVWLFAN